MPSASNELAKVAEPWDGARGINPFAYLGVAVADVGDAATRITEADETYDDDPDVSTIGTVQGQDTTFFSKVDGETYDDDPGCNGLNIPFQDATHKTSSDADTYDDDSGLSPLCVPRVLMDDTIFTRRDEETYDDDPSVAPLSYPRD